MQSASLTQRRPLLLLIGPYTWVHVNYCIVDSPPALTPVSTVLILVCVDFFYYWFHRFAHEVVACGHTPLSDCAGRYHLGWPLRAPLLGVLQPDDRAAPVASADSVLALHLPAPCSCCRAEAVCHHLTGEHSVPVLGTLAKVWGAGGSPPLQVHTKYVGRLPWIVEAVMMTPQHHRVHHDRRVHKNYGRRPA